MSTFKIIKPYLFICFALLSCGQRPLSYSDATPINRGDFKKEISLKAERVDIDILAPVQLQIYDTVLAVLNSRAEHLIHLYSLNTLEKIGERISVGQGSGEMLVPRFVETSGSQIMLSDIMTSSVVTYDWNTFINSKTPEQMDKIALNRRAFGEVRLLHDSYLAPARNPYSLLYRYNRKGEMIDSIGCYPDVNRQVAVEEKYNMFSFSLVTNGTDKVAVCYNWTDLIDIYDIKGNLLKRTHGPKQFISRFERKTDGQVVTSSPVKGETRDAFFCPVNMGDEIWVSYSGKSETEEGYNILSNQIYTFDWEGNPRTIMNLDQGIFAYAVDKKNKYIYGISEVPEFHILRFKY